MIHESKREPNATTVPSGDIELATVQATKTSTLTQEASQALEALRFNSGFIRPAYDSFCFANLPGFISHVLTGNEPSRSLPKGVFNAVGHDIDRVVMVFFDAFGWEALQRYSASSELLQTFATDGLVLKTTSQFPSTTAAHVTTLSSGKPVFETGVCEWFYYEPVVGKVINPFNLTPYNQMNEPYSLLQKGFTTEQLLPQGSLSRDMSAHAVTSSFYAPKEFFPSAYDRHFYTGALYPYETVAQGVTLLQEAFKRGKGKEFHHLYVADYDTVCHHHSNQSPQADASALGILKLLAPLRELAAEKKTLVLMTADHGQVPVKKRNEIAVNKLVPDIMSKLLVSPHGEVVRFGAGPRALFLYAAEGQQESLCNELRPKLSGAAEVYTQEEAATLGLLGPLPLTSRLKERMGNIILIPYYDYSLSWREEGVPWKDHLGHHGGCTTQEMETPLCLLRS